MKRKSFIALIAIVFAMFFVSCGNTGGGEDGDEEIENGNHQISTANTIVLAWNDLGMHCANPFFDSAVFLPPYNNLWAQVVRRGNPPQIVTSGIQVEYRLINNTTSQKQGEAPHESDFIGFWDNVLELFGVDLAPDTGLNLTDPDVHNGLSGTMLLKTDHFEADGIPATPLDDDLNWNPYQTAEITVKDQNGVIIAKTRATVPVSDEISCDKCHGNTTADFLDIHDADQGTNLVQNQPVLCANCHASPALGTADRIGGLPYLSEAIHSFHGSLAPQEIPECLDCHPGESTKCNRSLAHTAADGNCTTCHGELKDVGDSIANNLRTPWSDEPKCSTCHDGSTIAEVDTGSELYRNSQGHGGLFCPACHGSPHAMVPSREAADNYQALQYQGSSKTIGSCGACHNSSKGAGGNEFSEAHGGTNPEARNACHICHTVISTNRSNWPHSFEWNAR